APRLSSCRDRSGARRRNRRYLLAFRGASFVHPLCWGHAARNVKSAHWTWTPLGHEVRALQRRGPHFVLCDCTTPAGCPAMGRWGRCKVAIHAWCCSPVNTPTSTNPCRGGTGSHQAESFTDLGLSSTMNPSPLRPTRRRSTGFFVQPESWSRSTLENRQQRMCGRPGRGLVRRPPACCHMHR